jgi:uncharacterized protein YecT (DUF1311 family)
MRLTFAIIVLGLSPLISLAEAIPVDQAIKECWESNDHRGLSLCISKRATTAQENLETVENAMREAIAKSKEQANYLQPVQQSFEASVKSYRNYRTTQCQLREALAAMGNGATEIRLACETELDTNRAEQLKAGKWWLE